MWLFAKKCFACGMKIEKDGIKESVPEKGYKGEHQKDFCCGDCVRNYMENYKTGKSSAASCH